MTVCIFNINYAIELFYTLFLVNYAIFFPLNTNGYKCLSLIILSYNGVISSPYESSNYTLSIFVLFGVHFDFKSDALF